MATAMTTSMPSAKHRAKATRDREKLVADSAYCAIEDAGRLPKCPAIAGSAEEPPPSSPRGGVDE
jgi:hypothetical protein